MKTKLLLLLLPFMAVAQSNEVSLMGGYKALEVSLTHTASNDVVYGLAVSGVASNMAEKRANTKDLYHHEFNDDIIPAVFGLLGGRFDDFSIIGKLGTGYVNQHINYIQEKQKFYLAGGIAFEYKIADGLSVKTSFDSVNSFLAGITLYI